MRPILLIGRTGQLGWELQNVLPSLGTLLALDRTQMDITDPDSICGTIREANPRIIINAAGYTAVDKAEAEPELAMQVNGIAPGIMAEEAKRLDALLVHYSTDYVFDGTQTKPYTEEDRPNPLNTYGKTKLAGEQAIFATGCAHLTLRTSWIYSARGANFVLTMLRLAREKRELAVVNDQIGSPTWAKALAQSSAELLKKIKNPREHTGIYHLSATGYVSRSNFAEKIIKLMQTHSSTKTGWAKVRQITNAEYPLPAARPLYAATSKDKIKQVFGIEMANWDSQLCAFLHDIDYGKDQISRLRNQAS